METNSWGITQSSGFWEVGVEGRGSAGNTASLGWQTHLLPWFSCLCKYDKTMPHTLNLPQCVCFIMLQFYRCLLHSQGWPTGMCRHTQLLTACFLNKWLFPNNNKKSAVGKKIVEVSVGGDDSGHGGNRPRSPRTSVLSLATQRNLGAAGTSCRGFWALRKTVLDPVARACYSSTQKVEAQGRLHHRTLAKWVSDSMESWGRVQWKSTCLVCFSAEIDR